MDNLLLSSMINLICEYEWVDDRWNIDCQWNNQAWSLIIQIVVISSGREEIENVDKIHFV